MHFVGECVSRWHLRMESCDWRKKVGFWGSKANEEKAKSRHFELEMVSKRR